MGSTGPCPNANLPDDFKTVNHWLSGDKFTRVGNSIVMSNCLVVLVCNIPPAIFNPYRCDLQVRGLSTSPQDLFDLTDVGQLVLPMEDRADYVHSDDSCIVDHHELGYVDSFRVFCFRI